MTSDPTWGYPMYSIVNSPMEGIDYDQELYSRTINLLPWKHLSDPWGKFVQYFTYSPLYNDYTSLLPILVGTADELHSCVFVVRDESNLIFVVSVNSDLTCGKWPIGHEHLNDHYLNQILELLPLKSTQVMIHCISRVPIYIGSGGV